MTFLSITPDALLAETPASLRPATRLRPMPRAAHGLASLALAAMLMVPGAVVQAKWNRLGVVLSIVQQRCLASLSA